MLDQVKHIIAVGSGKGGVGKSTTAVNLALALNAQGKKVGLLDADIYGPSIAMMMGVGSGTRPAVQNGNTFLPVMAHGIATMSLAYLITDDTPMVWRGPMASGALLQMLQQTAWGELDALVVDLPPGTGDIQLTLCQKAQLSGAVIVTTPQDIALLDAKKAVEMFAKVKVPVLGVVENMAQHICSQCGHQEAIFGEGGGAAMAESYGTRLLGSLPLDIRIRTQGDCGEPVVIADAEGALAASYQTIEEQVLTAFEEAGENRGPEIVFS